MYLQLTEAILMKKTDVCLFSEFLREPEGHGGEVDEPDAGPSSHLGQVTHIDPRSLK